MQSTARTPRKLWLALILGFVGSVALIVTTESEPQAALQEKQAVQVELAPVKRSSLFPVERATGRLLPARRSTLSFEVTGRVIERLVEPGARVSEGQPLVRLADGDARDRLEESQAAYDLEKESVERDRQLLALAKKNTALARAEVKRFRRLQDKSLASGSQLDAARQTQLQLEAEEARLDHAVRTAAARIALKESQRDQAVRQLERTTLKAPQAGTVNGVQVDVGDYVAPNQPVIDLVDLDSLDLYVEARGDAVEYLELGQSLNVTVNGRELQGQLISLQYDPDPSTHTHALRVRLPGSQVRSGELASVELPRKPLRGALVIPVSAILNAEGRAFVFSYTDGVLLRKPVMLGPRVGDVHVVESGLEENESIVARDVAALNNGQTVEVSSVSS